MRIVKADKALKAIWSAGRRAITPKIGQLTNDAEAINKIVSIIRIELQLLLNMLSVVATNRRDYPSTPAPSPTSLCRPPFFPCEGYPIASRDGSYGRETERHSPCPGHYQSPWRAGQLRRCILGEAVSADGRMASSPRRSFKGFRWYSI